MKKHKFNKFQQNITVKKTLITQIKNHEPAVFCVLRLIGTFNSILIVQLIIDYNERDRLYYPYLTFYLNKKFSTTKSNRRNKKSATVKFNNLDLYSFF